MISYAGVNLLHGTQQGVDWVKLRIDPSWSWEFANLGGDSLRVPYGALDAFPDLPQDVGLLWWPQGASRFACARFLASGTQVDQIRQTVTGDAPAPLVMADALGNSITTDLYMLPARPLAQVQGTNHWYLLSLVDERFRWWFRAAEISVAGGTTSWQSLYSLIGAALGVSITVDAIPAAYLKPHVALTGRYDLLPLLLDAVAFSVGQRVVRLLDGTVWAMNQDTAHLRQKQEIDAQRPALAGGFYALGVGVS
jgi:hypothetical protein